MWNKLLILFSLLSATHSTIKDCDTSSQLKLTDLALYPDPPKVGDNVYMTVIFNNPGAEITDGKAVTSVTWNGIPLTPTTKPLCPDSTECPLTVGMNNRSTMSVWPSGVTGRVNSKIQWFDVSGKSLLCIQSSVSVASVHEQAIRDESKSLAPATMFGKPNLRFGEAHLRSGETKHHDPPTPHHSDEPKPQPPAPAPKPPAPAPHHSDKPKPQPPAPAPHHSDKPAPHHSDKPKHHHSDGPNPRPHPSRRPASASPVPSVPASSTTTSSSTGTTSSGTTSSGTTSSSTGSGTSSSGTTGGGTSVKGSGATINIYIKNIIRALRGDTTGEGTTSSSSSARRLRREERV